MGDEVDFLPANKHESFYKMIVSLWVCVSRHAQSTQNSKFAISLQHLKQNVKDEVGFFQADKRQSFFQIDTIILDVCFLNHFHNILRLFDVLPNFPFTASETMRDYYLQTWYKRVASRVAERHKS